MTLRRDLLTRFLARELSVLAVVVAPAALHAQIPDTFTNLKILSPDTRRPELMDAMKGFASALGVRCVHCHVGEDGPGFRGFDFASDQKSTKRTARVMWRMVRDINERQLAAIESSQGNRIQVTCETCHRGQERPLLTADLLLDVCRREGAAAAVARYRELREAYYGSQTHDFSEFMLIKVASALPETDTSGAAVRLLDLNIEMFPESAYSYFQRGMIHATEGATDRAIADLEKSLELQPGNRGAEHMLSQLKGE